ncbi:MAG TPA: HRDC domain-containing protein [Acidimicrobiales bacterium]|jgi:ribonuclease D|nr:HRDC domain-containing protein [Acidimicrobiales bacterium]
MSRSPSEPSLVVTPDQLDALCDDIVGEEFYGFDTEFHTERTYFPKLALIQLAWADRVALVDPLALDPAPLARLFAGPGIAVAHAADQDLDVLDAACGAVPGVVFDTQIVAGFLGLSTPSLSRLIDQILGITLPKADQLSDWLQRPISDRQITYAAGDVAYLLELRTILTKQLADLGRLTWALEECAEVLPNRRRSVVPEEAWWKMGDIRRLSERSRGVAQEVAAWRERRAAKVDRPRRTVLNDLALLAIAQRPPRNRSELEKVRGIDGRHLAQGGANEILEAIARGTPLTPDQLHLPPDGRDAQAPPAAVAVCSGLVRQIADNLSFDQSLLATRADISSLLCQEPSRLDVGWRNAIAGEPIRNLMGGKSAAAFETDGTLILEERSFRPAD